METRLHTAGANKPAVAVHGLHKASKPAPCMQCIGGSHCSQRPARIFALFAFSLFTFRFSLPLRFCFALQALRFTFGALRFALYTATARFSFGPLSTYTHTHMRTHSGHLRIHLNIRPLWEVSTKAMLKFHKLLGIVDGTDPEPTPHNSDGTARAIPPAFLIPPFRPVQPCHPVRPVGTESSIEDSASSILESSVTHTSHKSI